MPSTDRRSGCCSNSPKSSANSARRGLAHSGQGRNRDKTPEELESAVAAECADVVAMALLFAHNVGVDVGQALTDKWLPWEDYHRQRHDSDEAVPPVPFDANAQP